MDPCILYISYTSKIIIIRNQVFCLVQIEKVCLETNVDYYDFWKIHQFNENSQKLFLLLQYDKKLRLKDPTLRVKKMYKKIQILNFLMPMSPTGNRQVSTKNVSPFGPAVWPAKGNIYTNVLFYYINCIIKTQILNGENYKVASRMQQIFDQFMTFYSL